MSRRAYVVTGLGFGDEGKGTIVDFLTRKYDASLVVRHNGGAQAAHRVVTPDNKSHVFSQFGAGTLAGAKTHLSKYMVIHPLGLIIEAKHLESIGIKDPFSKLSISPQARIITPYQQAMNQIRELTRYDNNHGSCGIGVGECVSDSINTNYGLTYADLDNYPNTIRIFNEQYKAKVEETKILFKNNPKYLKLCLDRLDSVFSNDSIVEAMRSLKSSTHTVSDDQILNENNTIIFEGAQGILLDQLYGFYPHTTWSNCTDFNAQVLLKNTDIKDITRIGVVRSYATRHGAGPFPTEDKEMSKSLIDAANIKNRWQGDFRCGAFDIPLTKYAIKANKGIDYLAVTHLDKVTDNWPICSEYPEDIPEPESEIDEERTKKLFELKDLKKDFVRSPVEFMNTVSSRLNVDIKILSHGPTYQDKIINE